MDLSSLLTPFCGVRASWCALTNNWSGVRRRLLRSREREWEVGDEAETGTMLLLLLAATEAALASPLKEKKG